jgi:hypothetical protein
MIPSPFLGGTQNIQKGRCLLLRLDVSDGFIEQVSSLTSLVLPENGNRTRPRNVEFKTFVVGNFPWDVTY